MAATYFNIYKGDIDHANEILCDVIDELEMTDYYDKIMENAYDHANELIKMNGLENLTNILIEEMFESAKMFIIKKYPNADINIYVNGYDSHFNIEIDENE